MDDLPKFDPLAKCIKCGDSIPEPVKIPDPPAPAAKPAAKKPATAAASNQMPQAPGFGLPPKPAPPTVEYCSGEDCPWGDDTMDLGEHMHQFCDTCGFEWLSRPMDWVSN